MRTYCRYCQVLLVIHVDGLLSKKIIVDLVQSPCVVLKVSFSPFWNSFPLSAIYTPLFSRPVHPDSKNSGRERERERRESRRRVASEREERRPPRKGEGLLIWKPRKTRRRPGSSKKTDGVSGASGSVGRSVGGSGLARKRRPRTVRRGTPTQASAKEARQSVSQ